MFSPKQTLFKMLTHSVRVTRIENVSPRLCLLRLEGESIKKATWVPGEKIKLQMGSKLKSYTPSSFNCEEGWLEIILFLHGQGGSSKWISSLTLGDQTGMLGPSKSMPLPLFSPSRVLFLGDETTVGLAIALVNSLSSSTTIEGAIELNQEDQGVLSTLHLPLDAALRSTQSESSLVDWLTQWLSQETSKAFIEDPQAIIWLSGEAEPVLSLKKSLLSQGISSERIFSKPYWSRKGHRHRKAIQRQLK